MGGLSGHAVRGLTGNARDVQSLRGDPRVEILQKPVTVARLAASLRGFELDAPEPDASS